ncbi:MAG: hypothetical protein JNM25_16545 [Planctomycetes bacterium]|nr:hypothetical protein [Planctomycetota bacterium]
MPAVANGRWADIAPEQRDAFRLAVGEHANRRAKALLAARPELITRWFR